MVDGIINGCKYLVERGIDFKFKADSELGESRIFYTPSYKERVNEAWGNTRDIFGKIYLWVMVGVAVRVAAAARAASLPTTFPSRSHSHGDFTAGSRMRLYV